MKKDQATIDFNIVAWSFLYNEQIILLNLSKYQVSV